MWFDKIIMIKLFPTLYDYYETYNDHVESQHELISDYYLDKIKGALFEVLPGLNPIYCTALAWMGLTETEAWNELPKNERDLYIEIQNSYINEIQN